MDVLELSQQIVERYRRYLLTTFSFRDPVLRTSFEDALNKENLSRGPYIEATPPFRRGRTPRELFEELLEEDELPDKGFLQALLGGPLYRHQEEAIRRVVSGQNVVVATGTGSGKTEAFLYAILLHLYREFRRGKLGSGVRALILYPMNALAHDQRERLGELCLRIEEFGSDFRFTFGQYIGETPEDEQDDRRQAKEHLERRLPGELVLRREMRETPPHILLTNYSMLEYLLLRPDDSPLFDNGRARWWTFLVLDEVHQYRGTRGTEMALLIRRLKQRLRAGGRFGPFRCIATSATLLGGEEDRAAVARNPQGHQGKEADRPRADDEDRGIGLKGKRPQAAQHHRQGLCQHRPLVRDTTRHGIDPFRVDDDPFGPTPGKIPAISQHPRRKPPLGHVETKAFVPLGTAGAKGQPPFSTGKQGVHHHSLALHFPHDLVAQDGGKGEKG